MPNPLDGLRNAGIQADAPAQRMTDFRKAHPWISTAGDILTGGATNPEQRMGPVDLLAAGLPFLGGVKPAADLVPVLEHLSPSERALVEMLHKPLPEPNLAGIAAGSRATGMRRPMLQYIKPPSGFKAGEGFERVPRPIPAEDKIWWNFDRAQKQLQADPRETMPESLPSIQQIEQGPAIRGLKELSDVGGKAPAAYKPPMTSFERQAQQGVLGTKHLHRTNKLSDDTIRAIRKDQGTLSAEQAAAKHNTNHSTVRNIWSGDSWQKVK